MPNEPGSQRNYQWHRRSWRADLGYWGISVPANTLLEKLSVLPLPSAIQQYIPTFVTWMRCGKLGSVTGVMSIVA